MSQNLISLQEAADLIGKNLRTIQRCIKSGKLTAHLENGKNLVSRSELENKFKISDKEATTSTLKPEVPLEEKTKQEIPSVASSSRWEEMTERYRDKWENEIQAHSKTREELGVWRGRAESYQNFASRLLNSGFPTNEDKQAKPNQTEEPTTPKPVKDFWPKENLETEKKYFNPIYGYLILVLVAIISLGLVYLFAR